MATRPLTVLQYRMLSRRFLPRLRPSTFDWPSVCSAMAGVSTCPLVALTAPDSVRYFGHPTGNWLGLIVASLYMGPVVTTWIGDWLNVKLGRKPVLYIGSVIVIIGASITAFAQSTNMFIAGK